MIAIDGSDAILDRAAGLLHRELGLRPDPAMLSRLRRCLRDEAAARQQEPDAYIETLTADRAVRQSLFDRVTVQETSFFRHPGQFEALAHHVLPHLAGPVTMWSAGCANGQEAYSLAMVLDEHGAQGTVMATDVSTKALERTAGARYFTRELTGLSSARRARHLTGGPHDFEIRRSIRDRVVVQHHNLVTDGLPDYLACCQVVFCRNVLIYFSPEQATAFLTRLAGQLPAGAFLFLGYAETIWQVTDLFEPVRIGASFECHRRREQPTLALPGPARRVGPARPDRVLGRPARPPAPASIVGRPAKPAISATSPAAATSAEQTLELTRTGQAAAADRDYPTAITAFRKCVYLAPDDPMSHLHLGLALEASGDRVSAGRAFDAARAALHRFELPEVVAALGGYRSEELLGFLDSRREGRCQR
jgi:chemotaxis protein methyltransferase CheR